MPKQISADPIRFQQIFSNLISNATKFTGKNGTIMAEIKYVEKEKDDQKYIVLRVADSGIGMNPETMKSKLENNEILLLCS